MEWRLFKLEPLIVLTLMLPDMSADGGSKSLARSLCSSISQKFQHSHVVVPRRLVQSREAVVVLLRVSTGPASSPAAP